ncbi:MAG: hypothetical protein DWQ36_16330 [Acidobacteria bacterium]|nr:MAG: hypothetical protein DWQ30_16400 [Acidobacteriota bacterium]REK05374.1 MAG: hypothetical protein DWQ36_16330 [Acidobacteriota bacterium]
MLPTTALYAGLLGLLAIVLGAGSGLLRMKTGVSMGDGGDPRQLAAMRRHGNFTEWAPIALVLIAILELNGVGNTAVHVLGATLVLARVAHAMGLSANMRSALRGLGASLTTLVILVAAVWCIVTSFA